MLSNLEVLGVDFLHLEENRMNNCPHWVVDYWVDMGCYTVMMTEDLLGKVVCSLLVHSDRVSIDCLVEPSNWKTRLAVVRLYLINSTRVEVVLMVVLCLI